ncbi:uncharacterized protein LOC103180288 [Callorhinchus milii]|uniref:uncharacterized protein LOC103180288 n=1 Tax=Callorhinchus milii TaxID=7868 RepID=UPI001C3F609B|nr:uncharacterized protein LOC103180288 [Callorhinchus milii]
MNASNLLTAEQLVPIAAQQNVLVGLADFCMPAFTVSLLSVISLLTYFDVLESFPFFHWLDKAGALQKKRSLGLGRSYGDNCLVKAEEECSLAVSTAPATVHNVLSAAQRVRLLEADLCMDDFHQQNVDLCRKKCDTLWRDLNQVDNVLLRLGGEDLPVKVTQTRELVPDTKSAPHSPASEGDAAVQKDTTMEKEPTAGRHAQKIQLLRNRLQPMRTYVEERLQLLKTFSDYLESYRMGYRPLRSWVTSTYQFQEWIHSMDCDSDFLIVKSLGHQKRIAREIEEKLPRFNDCLQTLNECTRISKEIQAQAVTFHLKIKPDGGTPGEIPQQAGILDSFQREFFDTKQQFLLLVKLTQCYVIHLRDLLRLKRGNNAFVKREPEHPKERSGLKTFLKGKRH